MTAAERRNMDICVDVALDVMCSKGWIEETTDDEELEADLRRIYREAQGVSKTLVQMPIVFKKREEQVDLLNPHGVLLYNMCQARPGEYLAHMWEYEQQQLYERSCPRFICDYDGTEVGAYEWYWGKFPTFYVLDETGCFAETTTVCPGCGRDIRTMLARDGQLAIFETGGQAWVSATA